MTKNQRLNGNENLVKVVSDDVPDFTPLNPDTTHVVVTNFHDLLEREHPMSYGIVQLFAAYFTQRVREIHCAECGCIKVIKRYQL